MKFKQFLTESEDNQKLHLILDILEEMGEEELRDLGYSLYNDFFDEDDEIGDGDYDFCLDDVKDMVSKIDPEYYDDILDLLHPSESDFDFDNITLDDDFYKQFYGDIDDFDEISDMDESSLEEALSILGRLKRAMTIKRNAKKIQKAKALKARKTFMTKDDLNKRTRRLAVKILTMKWGKGRTDKVTKERIENRLAASKDLIARLAAKQRKIVIKNYKERIAARKAAKKGINKEV